MTVTLGQNLSSVENQLAAASEVLSSPRKGDEADCGCETS